MSEMTANESIERFDESLKKCVSRCKEMAALQKNTDWLKIATHLESLLVKGRSFYRQGALTRQQTLELSERILASAASDAPNKS